MESHVSVTVCGFLRAKLLLPLAYAQTMLARRLATAEAAPRGNCGAWLV